MSQRKPDTVSGVVIINKHEGVTSHRIISILRRMYDTQRVGHTGTLDPMATGVLPVMIGRAVKA
jgi:tRNA pseudouridine55 synthase